MGIHCTHNSNSLHSTYLYFICIYAQVDLGSYTVDSVYTLLKLASVELAILELALLELALLELASLDLDSWHPNTIHV